MCRHVLKLRRQWKLHPHVLKLHPRRVRRRRSVVDRRRHLLESRPRNRRRLLESRPRNRRRRLLATRNRHRDVSRLASLLGRRWRRS